MPLNIEFTPKIRLKKAAGEIPVGHPHPLTAHNQPYIKLTAQLGNKIIMLNPSLAKRNLQSPKIKKENCANYGQDTSQ